MVYLQFWLPNMAAAIPPCQNKKQAFASQHAIKICLNLLLHDQKYLALAFAVTPVQWLSEGQG